jgi:hypothetical protein
MSWRLVFIITGIVCTSLIAYGILFELPEEKSKVSKVPPREFSTPSIEAEGFCYSVLDGDTIWTGITKVNPDLEDENILVGALVGDTFYGDLERIRFGGGIDSPEFGQTGFYEARDFVLNLILEGENFPNTQYNKIYLDLDNLAVSNTGQRFRDKTPSERLVAVVYVKIDGKLVNINAELLRWGRVNYPNHDWLKYRYLTSEFDPDEWLDVNYPYLRS